MAKASPIPGYPCNATGHASSKRSMRRPAPQNQEEMAACVGIQRDPHPALRFHRMLTPIAWATDRI